MMGSTIPRFLAAVLLLVQLQHLPGAVLCAVMSQDRAAACDDMGTSSGPAVGAAQEPGTVVCSGLGPCAAPLSVVVPVGLDTSIAGDIVRIGVAAAPTLPPGFEPAPIPPPPQA